MCCNQSCAAGASLQVKELSLKIVKGYTKIQAILFTLLSCTDVDLSAPDSMEILKPLYPVLDRAWLVPVHVLWQKSMANKIVIPFL